MRACARLPTTHGAFPAVPGKYEMGELELHCNDVGGGGGGAIGVYGRLQRNSWQVCVRVRASCLAAACESSASFG